MKTTTFLQRLAGLEVWIVGAAVAASVALPRLLPVACLVALVFWPLRWLATGRLSRPTPVDGPILLLVLLLPLTLWVSALPDTTVPQVLRLLSGIGLFYAIVNWATAPERWRLALMGISLAGLGLSLFAPFSVEWGVEKLPFIPMGIYRRFAVVVSDAVNPNVMAGAVILLLPCTLALLLFAWRELGRVERWVYPICALAMSTTLLLTQSRGALMGIVVAVALLVVLRWRFGWLVVLLLGGGSAATVMSMGSQQVLDALTTSNSLGTFDQRLEIWDRALLMIRDFPFTGVGMGLFKPALDLLYPLFLGSSDKIPHAHNIFLQVAVDLGIPGLVAWLTIFALVVVAAWQLLQRGKRTRDTLTTALGAGLLASQSALAIHGLTDAVTWGMVRTAVLVWVVWGLAFVEN